LVGSQKAKEEVKVLVSGAGADELFAGYNRHKAFRHYLNHTGILEKLATFSDFPFPAYLKKLLQSISKDPKDTFIQMAAVEKIPEAYLGIFNPGIPKVNSILKMLWIGTGHSIWSMTS
jgi:asparagine synthase (glutamine-hydrolysing)